MMLARTVPSVLRTAADVSSQDVSSPSSGPGSHADVPCESEPIMTAYLPCKPTLAPKELVILKAPRPLQGFLQGSHEGTSFRQWRELLTDRQLNASQGFLLDERRSSIAQDHLDFPAVLEPPFNQFLGQGIADRTLNRSAHRASSVQRLVSFFDEPLFDFVVDFDFDAFFQQAQIEFSEQNVENAVEVFLVELVEHDNLVDPVQEFRAEGTAQVTKDFFLLAAILFDFRALEAKGHAFLDQLGPDV